MNTNTAPNVAPFELLIGKDGGRLIDNGDVPVQWCVTPELAVDLEEKGFTDPHILLVTAHLLTGAIMMRKLIPLTEIKTYVRFSKAGESRIGAWIVNGATGRKQLRKTFLDSTNGTYNTDIYLTDDGGYDDFNLSNVGEVMRAELGITNYIYEDVKIPANVFGAEPSPWVKWYTNLWCTTRVVDQCNFRQRMLFAFTIKLVPIMIWTALMVLVRFLWCTLHLFGGFINRVHFSRVFRPYYWPGVASLETEDAASKEFNLFDNRFFIKLTHRFNRHRKDQYLITLFAFSPLFLILFGGFNLITGIQHPDMVLAELAIEYIPTLLFLICAGIVFDIIAFLYIVIEMTGPGKKIAAMVERFITWIKVNNYETGVYICSCLALSSFIGWTIYSNWETYGYFVALFSGYFAFCAAMYWAGLWFFENKMMIRPEDNKPTKVQDLMCPCDEACNIKRKTIRLYYLDLKNKLCKPMQL